MIARVLSAWVMGAACSGRMSGPDALPTGEPKPGCTPTSCSQPGAPCGSIPDGCGGTLQCGSCSTGCGSAAHPWTPIRDCQEVTRSGCYQLQADLGAPGRTETCLS